MGISHAAAGAVRNIVEIDSRPLPIELHEAPDAAPEAVAVSADGWITSGSRAMGEIVIPQRCSPAEQYAALELREFIYRATDVSLPIRPEGRRPLGTVLSIGRTKALRENEAAPAMLLPGPEDFIVRRIGRTIYLVGGEDRGTLYAVYSFLENEVGVRWLAPGRKGARIPELRGLFIGDINRRESPALSFRGAGFAYIAGRSPSKQLEYYIWAARNRLNTWDSGCPDNERFYHERGGWALASLGPAGGTIEDRVFDGIARAQHPELCAWVDAHRRVVDGRAELSEPEAVRRAADALILELNRYPFLDTLFLTPSPGELAWSEDEIAAKRDPTGPLTNAENGTGPGDRPDRVAAFVREVAAVLKGKGCSIRIAYEAPVEKPPLVQKLPDTALVFLSPFSAGYPANDLEKWRGAGGSLIVRIATASVGKTDLERASDLAEKMRLFQKQGLSGVWIDVAEPWPASSPLPYVTARLAWDPSLDPKKLLRE